MVQDLGRRTLLAVVVLVLAGLVWTPAAGASDPELRIERDARRRTLRLQVGPVSLPANLGYDAVAIPVGSRGIWGVDGWLRAFEVHAVDGSGRPIGATLIHHAALLAPGERDLFSDVTRRIVAFGMETDGIQLPGQLGYRVEPQDSVIFIGALFNPTDHAFEEVYLRIDIVYADARHDAQHQSVLPMFLDAVGSGTVSFDLPPGESTQSWEWTPAIAGRVLALGGHLHQHGVSVQLEDVASGEVLWVGEAEYAADGSLAGVTRHIFARGVRLTPDRAYRVTAKYFNPTGEVLRGAMGHVAGLFLPEHLEDMPPADRSAPAYLMDLEARTGPAQHQHHAH